MKFKLTFAVVILSFFWASLARSQSSDGILKVPFTKQVLVAEDGFYVDGSSIKRGYRFSERLKRIVFRAGRSQYILEPNGSGIGLVKMYSLTVRKSDQKVMVVNDFVSFGNEAGFESRKVGWIADINKDGHMDLVHRQKTQIRGNQQAQNKSQSVVNAGFSRAPSSLSLYQSDKLKLLLWDKSNRMYIEKELSSVEKKKHSKKYDFRFKWWNYPSRSKTEGSSNAT